MRRRVAWSFAAILVTVVLVSPVVASELPDRWGRTPLMQAALKGDAAAVQALLAQGATVNARDQYGMTALMWAAPDIVPLLLQSGADIHARDNFGRTALTYAAFEEDAATVKLMLDHGAEVDPKDSFGETPLFWATGRPSQWLYLEIPNIGNSNPPRLNIVWDLDRAHVGQDAEPAEVVSLLLARGANPNARDNRSWTPLTTYTWAQPLWSRHFRPGTLKDRSSIVELLVAKGADVNDQGSDGNTALMGAALHLDGDMVKLLLKHGADVKLKRRDGQTALSMASEARLHQGASEKTRDQVKALLGDAASTNPVEGARMR